MTTKTGLVMREDWVECELGDILRLKNGYAFKSSAYTDNGIPIIRISDIKLGSVKTINSKKVAESDTYDDFVVKNGDILIAMSGATTGKFGIYISNDVAYQNQRVGNLQIHDEKSISKKLTFYMLHNLKREIEKTAYGGAQPNISGKKIEALTIFLPPLPEQRAIVTKLENLFTELDAGVASLNKAKVQLKIYRQAVLKQAFEGELTREWREAQTDLPTAAELLENIQVERERYYAEQVANWEQAVQEWEAGGKVGKKPGRVRKMKVFAAKNPLKNEPDWYIINMGNIAHKIQIGPFGSQLHKSDYVEEGIPIVNPKHIKDQKIYPNERITLEKANSLKQYYLKQNDIILGRRGEMGRSAPISEKEHNWFCGTGSICIRLGDQFISKLYSLIFSSKQVVNYLEEKGGGTTMTNLNLKILEELPIQLIPLPEQHQIVQEIESRLSVCDRLEADIAINLQKAESLRQSLLKRAFAGALLTPEELAACRAEADWEPAEVLLARVKKEKKKKE